MRLRSLAFGLCLSMGAYTLSAQTTLPPPSDPPPNAEDGKCYAICVIPDQTEAYTETIEIQGARTTTVVQVPEYETASVRIMTQPASVRSVYVPAEYEVKTERVEIRPASMRYEVIPAKFEEREERVLVEEGTTEYRTFPAEFDRVTNANLYYGTGEFGTSADYGNLLDPNNPNNPNNPDSPFNPARPDSPFNPENPNSPFNPDSPFNFDNPNNVLSPDSPDNPYNAANVGTRGLGNDTETAARQLIEQAGTGTILPYITREARVEVERVARTYRTVSEEIEIRPAGTTYVRTPAPCADGREGCVAWCPVEVPAEYQTINRQVAEDCADGYTPGTNETGGSDYCVKLRYIPARYGERSIMKAGPRVEERTVESRYITVKKMVKVQDAEVKEIEVPAEYRDVERRVIKNAAYVRQDVVPAEYETVTRQVRRGLADVDYIDATGTLLLPSVYQEPGTRSLESFPSVVNPATGYSLPDAPVTGRLGEGRPRSGMVAANDSGSLNTGDTPGGLPDNYYTAGCPSGFRFDPMDNTCKQTVEVPAVTQTITKQRITKKGGFSEWTEVLCPNKVTNYTIRQVQRALAEKGYNPGPVDNVMGAQTKSALTKFQRENNLPVGGLNIATVRALGLQ